ncbi:MAG: hypothetical protein IJN27_01510 [Oscillospiraceae bacterium]|nr:hypothetical protein [Oscillospiraceae bacterium]
MKHLSVYTVCRQPKYCDDSEILRFAQNDSKSGVTGAFVMLNVCEASLGLISLPSAEILR